MKLDCGVRFMRDFGESLKLWEERLQLVVLISLGEIVASAVSARPHHAEHQLAATPLTAVTESTRAQSCFLCEQVRGKA